jgi:hypothetical protein
MQGNQAIKSNHTKPFGPKGGRPETIALREGHTRYRKTWGWVQQGRVTKYLGFEGGVRGESPIPSSSSARLSIGSGWGHATTTAETWPIRSSSASTSWGSTDPQQQCDDDGGDATDPQQQRANVAGVLANDAGRRRRWRRKAKSNTRGAMAAGCGSFFFSTLQRRRERVRWATARATHVGVGVARRRHADRDYCLCPTGVTSYAIAQEVLRILWGKPRRGGSQGEARWWRFSSFLFSFHFLLSVFVSFFQRWAKGGWDRMGGWW